METTDCKTMNEPAGFARKPTKQLETFVCEHPECYKTAARTSSQKRDDSKFPPLGAPLLRIKHENDKKRHDAMTRTSVPLETEVHAKEHLLDTMASSSFSFFF